MQVTGSKIISLLIAVTFGVVLTQDGFTESACKSCAGLALPLALIWFPDQIGSFTGRNITTETPPILISLAGWFLLVGLPVLVSFLR